MRHLISLAITFSVLTLSAQWGPEGIKYSSEESYGGYTMFENSLSTFLVDNCGEIVNTWEVTNSELHTKLLPDGQLIYLQNNRVYIRDWDDNIQEVIAPGDDDIILVYEVIELENKNLLCLARELFSESDFDAIGYEFSPGESASRIDAVVELDRATGDVVWRWNLSDHVIQERDIAQPNYGVVKDNPQLLDLDAVLEYDWTFQESFMINGMDYNAELDQIVLSIRKINEIAIIDHSTTTEEAAGSTGGKYGKGGDILYRWGNPQNYGYGDEDDHLSYYQHNPNWIHYGEHAGSIIYYNNGLTRPGNFSEAYIIKTPHFEGNYIREDDQAFGPEVPTEIYSENTTNISDLFSEYTSGAKVLPNGNIFITEGDEAILREFTPDGILVWEYHVPLSGYIFRGVRYGADYPAFEGRDLTPQGTVEQPPSDYECSIMTTTSDLTESTLEILFSQNKVDIVNPDLLYYAAKIISLSGMTVQKFESDQFHEKMTLMTQQSGLYILQIMDRDSGKLLNSVKFMII